MTDETRTAWQRITDSLAKREGKKSEPAPAVETTAQKVQPPAETAKKPKKKTKRRAAK